MPVSILIPLFQRINFSWYKYHHQIIPATPECVSLTPWNRVLLDKLTGSQLVMKFPAYYGTRRFITAFICARQLSLFWASSIHSIPPHPTSWRCSHLRPGLPSCLIPSDFPIKTLYTPLLSLIRATCPVHLIILHLITREILGEYRSLSSSLRSFLHSLYLVPLRPKYSPQHHILKHPQPTFLPQCERSSSTPIHNRKNYSSVYLNLQIF
jgi:hypothetical protein